MALTMQVKKKVDGFRLDVRLNLDGQTTVFVGPSGAGKTMTLQLIAGLTKPDSGLIRIQDNVVFDSDKGIDLPPQMRGIGYVFQNLALFPHMTVLQNILYGGTGMIPENKLEQAHGPAPRTQRRAEAELPHGDTQHADRQNGPSRH